MQGRTAKATAKAAAEEPVEAEATEAPPEEAARPVWESPLDIPARVNAARRVVKWAFWVGGWSVTHSGEHRLSITWHVTRWRNHQHQRKTVSLNENTTPGELARILSEVE